LGDANASSKLAAAGGSVMSTAVSAGLPILPACHTAIGVLPASAWWGRNPL
jgi:hypothetical protein